MDFIESLSFPFYCTDLPTACMPARADAIYVVFSDEKMKVCKLFLLLAVGNYLSLRCIRGLEILWRTRALQVPAESCLQLPVTCNPPGLDNIFRLLLFSNQV